MAELCGIHFIIALANLVYALHLASWLLVRLTRIPAALCRQIRAYCELALLLLISNMSQSSEECSSVNLKPL